MRKELLNERGLDVGCVNVELEDTEVLRCAVSVYEVHRVPRRVEISDDARGAVNVCHARLPRMADRHRCASPICLYPLPLVLPSIDLVKNYPSDLVVNQKSHQHVREKKRPQHRRTSHAPCPCARGCCHPGQANQCRRRGLPTNSSARTSSGDFATRQQGAPRALAVGQACRGAKRPPGRACGACCWRQARAATRPSSCTPSGSTDCTPWRAPGSLPPRGWDGSQSSGRHPRPAQWLTYAQTRETLHCRWAPILP
mmetsp:Transcript_34371/g.106709  ORF Transcript_34371/g.106709 Transcript_34371/m.106709 type:complete len:255 (-) Transcript_34371:199-963(-)